MPEASEEIIEEGCYYLRKLGLSVKHIAERFDMSEEIAEQYYHSFEDKLARGVVKEDEITTRYWREVYRDAEGDVRVTFVGKDGFYHARQSDLEKMDNSTLMMVFEKSKYFLETDPNKYFLDTPPPVGFDPLALSRQVKSAVEIIQQILKRRWEKESAKGAA